MKLQLQLKQINQLQKEGFTRKKIANFADKSERTIYRWIKETDQPKQKEGPKFRIAGQELKSLLTYVLENNTKTQLEITNYVLRQMDINISRQTVGRILQRHGITRKKLTYHYADQLKHKEKIRKFKELVPCLPQSRIFALDECSFHLNEAPRYGYAHKSSRAVSQRPGKKGSNHTLLLCIQNLEKGRVIHWELIEGSAKSQNFHEFLKGINPPNDEKSYLILDNARVHIATKSCWKLGLPTVKEFLLGKNIEPLYLPPYTPELNPVELCFNFLRQQIEKRRPRNFEELKSEIDKIINMLNQKDLSQYFRHCFAYEIWH